MDDEALAPIFDRLGLPTPTREEVDAALKLARAVAHASERRAAPLVCYAAGLQLTQAADPARRADRLRALVDAASEILAEARDDD